MLRCQVVALQSFKVTLKELTWVPKSSQMSTSMVNNTSSSSLQLISPNQILCWYDRTVTQISLDCQNYVFTADIFLVVFRNAWAKEKKAKKTVMPGTI